MTTSDNEETDETLEQESASAGNERLQSPHDRLINQTLQQAEAARTLFEKNCQGN